MAGHLGRAEPTPASGSIALPALVTDPIWSLKQWSVVVDVGDEEYTIPAMPAADWLRVLMVDDISIDDVFPGMLEPVDRAQVEEALHAGILTLADIQEVSLEIVSKVSGRPWWVAMRLIQCARISWDALGGEMVRKVDGSTLSLGAWLDGLFLVILRAMEESKRNMFLMKLEMPPPGWGSAVQEELEMSTDAFLAMASE